MDSENPFCTRRIRPGAIPFVFSSELDAEALTRRLRQSGWWGEILGAHGAGKSALLATLIPTIERGGQLAVLVELHDGQRRLPPGVITRCTPNSATLFPEGEKCCSSSRVMYKSSQPFTLLIVDGYEQLSRWSRWRLKRLCRRRGWGLLVTAHASVGLPELYRTATTAELAEKIVGQLLAGQAPPFTAEELSECFARRRGDMRETLFDLYDIYERRRPSRGRNLT